LGGFENDGTGPSRCGFFGGTGRLFDRCPVVGRHSKAEDGVFSLNIGQLVASHTDERSHGLLAVNPQLRGPGPAGPTRGESSRRRHGSCPVHPALSGAITRRPAYHTRAPWRVGWRRNNRRDANSTGTPPGLPGPSGRALDRPPYWASRAVAALALGAFAGLEQDRSSPGNRPLVQTLGRGFDFALFFRRQRDFHILAVPVFRRFWWSSSFHADIFYPSQIRVQAPSKNRGQISGL
jgi:hypothetical protein